MLVVGLGGDLKKCGECVGRKRQGRGKGTVGCGTSVLQWAGHLHSTRFSTQILRAGGICQWAPPRSLLVAVCCWEHQPSCSPGYTHAPAKALEQMAKRGPAHDRGRCSQRELTQNSPPYSRGRRAPRSTCHKYKALAGPGIS